MFLHLVHYLLFPICLLKLLPSALSSSDFLWHNSQNFHKPFRYNTDPTNLYYTSYYQSNYDPHPQHLFLPSGEKRFVRGGYGGKAIRPTKMKLRENDSSQMQLYSLKKKECNGMEHLLMDLGLVSYGIGVAGFIIGIIDLGWSMAGQFFSATSTWASYIAAIPSAIITLSGKADPLTYLIANIFSVISIWATIWSHIGLPVGDVSIILGFLGEALGLVSIIIGAFSTFPKLLTDLIQFLVDKEGREVQVFVDNYRCPN